MTYFWHFNMRFSLSYSNYKKRNPAYIQETKVIQHKVCKQKQYTYHGNTTYFMGKQGPYIYLSAVILIKMHKEYHRKKWQFCRINSNV